MRHVRPFFGATCIFLLTPIAAIFGDSASHGSVGSTQAFQKLLFRLLQTEPSPRPVVPAPESARTKALRAKLDEPIAIELPNETALEDVLASIKKATKKGPNDPGVPIYIDPAGLQEVGSTFASIVRIKERRLPLRVLLDRLGDQLGFAYTVKDEVVIISSPAGIRQELKDASVCAKDASPKTKVVMAKLEKPITLPFDADTGLDCIFEYIKTSTRKAPTDIEIPIIVVPSGLKEAKTSLNSTVIIDLEGVPLRTSLRLLLKQRGLAYAVKEGRVIINTPDALAKLKSTGVSPELALP
jgi:hypothetical protein